jgi:hypothetical protein
VPRPKRIHTFPPDYRRLFEAALTRGKVSIRMHSRGAAERLRLKLYTYRDSLLAYYETSPRLALLSLSLTFHLVDEARGTILHITDETLTPESRAIRKGLDSANTDPTDINRGSPPTPR